MKTEVSCDRCHRLKAKCVFPPGISICDRCSRLQHKCITSRVSAQRGRRRKDDKLLGSAGRTGALVWVGNEYQSKLALTNDQTRLKDIAQNAQNHLPDTVALNLIQLPPPEDQILEILWSEDFVHDFVIGPSFAGFFQDMVRRSFASSPGILRDTYLATAAAFLQVRRGEPGNEAVNINRTSMSLERLRCFQPKNLSHIALLSGLGLSIVTYEILTASASSHAVVAFILLSLKSWLPLANTDPDLEFNLTSLIFMDTVNCLMNRKVPIIRYETDKFRIDRSVGLCCGFLPIMYDVCLVSHNKKHEGGRHPVNDSSEWARVQDDIEKWQPVEPPDFLENYQHSEIVSMRTQAIIYQSAVSLLIYRLQHPYDGIDEVGMSFSGSILSSLDVCFRVTGSYPLATFFPLLLASLELANRHTRNEIMEAIEARFQPVFTQFLTKMKCILKNVWGARDSGRALSWNQIMNLFPKTFFLP